MGVLTLTAVPEKLGSGGAGLYPGSTSPTIRTLLEEHRAALAALDAAGSDEAASQSQAGTMSAADKKFLDNVHAAAGTAIADADGNIAVAQGYWRVLATLTGNRSYTLQTTGAVAGDQIEITRTSTAANTAAFINGGAGAGTLLTMPVSKVNSAKFQFDGTNWALRSCGTQ